jgi:PAS domain S-box-containing protein
VLEQTAIDVARILQTVAQPVWVVDADGRICFANPAAVAALGYEHAGELVGRSSHATIHYKKPDGSPNHLETCPLRLPQLNGETVSGRRDWFVRRDGSMIPVEYSSAPIDLPGGRGSVVAFADIEERLRTEQALHDRDVAEARAAELAAAGRRIIEAADTERRRLERNLHDGAQQRLVALALNLRLAARRLGDNPEAQAVLTEACVELGEALQELRELAQGIHPAVLTERGLEPALAALAGRAPIPVELAVALEERLPGPVEAAAYYVVAEALTNAAKYAECSAVRVHVARSRRRVRIEVADDGVGGAKPEGGSGLRGLGDRVEALGGVLVLDSPTGAGTTLRAEIPCAPDVAGRTPAHVPAGDRCAHRSP